MYEKFFKGRNVDKINDMKSRSYTNCKIRYTPVLFKKDV